MTFATLPVVQGQREDAAQAALRKPVLQIKAIEMMSAYLTCQQTLSLRTHVTCCNKVAGLNAFATRKITFHFKISILTIKALLSYYKMKYAH